MREGFKLGDKGLPRSLELPEDRMKQSEGETWWWLTCGWGRITKMDDTASTFPVFPIRIICWQLIFVFRLSFAPGVSKVDILGWVNLHTTIHVRPHHHLAYCYRHLSSSYHRQTSLGLCAWGPSIVSWGMPKRTFLSSESVPVNRRLWVGESSKNAKDLTLFFEIHSFVVYLIIFCDLVCQKLFSYQEKQPSYRARGPCLPTIRSYHPVN